MRRRSTCQSERDESIPQWVTYFLPERSRVAHSTKWAFSVACRPPSLSASVASADSPTKSQFLTVLALETAGIQAPAKRIEHFSTCRPPFGVITAGSRFNDESHTAAGPYVPISKPIQAYEQSGMDLLSVLLSCSSRLASRYSDILQYA